MTLPSRQDTLALMHEYTASESLRKHMLAVEGAMRAYARKFGEDEERWGITGLIHDFDYERFPNNSHSATEEHPSEGVRILRGKGYPDDILQAILGHATYCNTPRDSRMAKALFAVDELTGLITATALVRPSKSVHEVTQVGAQENEGQSLRRASEPRRRITAPPSWGWTSTSTSPSSSARCKPAPPTWASPGPSAKRRRAQRATVDLLLREYSPSSTPGRLTAHQSPRLSARPITPWRIRD